MNQPFNPDTDRDAYYVEAASWAEDAAEARRRSQRIAWIVAGVLGTIALLEAIALAMLVPLKTVVPYVVTVDRQTGATQVTQRLLPGALTQNQAVTQAALVRYVTARESFDSTDLAENYRNVQRWSAADVRAAYLAAMAPQNPASPLRVYPKTATVAVVVKGVSLLGPDTALVRFDLERRDGGVAATVQPFAAAIAFRYTGEPLSAEERFANPLGFQVTRYRRDAEAAAPVPLPR